MDRGSSSGHAPASRAALELVVVAGDALTVVPLPPRGAVTLGRGEECDIRIEHRSVSRRHAVLHLEPSLRIEDLGSANGTFVRDAQPALGPAGAAPLRKLSRESSEVVLGSRVNLGAIPVLVRRAGGDRYDAAAAADVVVRDPGMRALHEQATRAARSPISVLLLGEVGVGKEVLARAIHDRSPRAEGPFVAINCAALPPAVLESELFGHEQGTLSGGPTRPSLLEAADGGTVFLDEVGALPPPVQVKLLRVLEDNLLSIAGRPPRQLDLRFVAATHLDLGAEAARRTFRQDLYFRLNGLSFVIPPLRERVAEVAPLAELFLAGAARMLGRTGPPLRLSPEVLGCLERYGWPGNVRELRNVIERASVLAEGDVLLPADLPGHLTGSGTGPFRRVSPSTPTGSFQRATTRELPRASSSSGSLPRASSSSGSLPQASSSGSFPRARTTTATMPRAATATGSFRRTSPGMAATPPMGTGLTPDAAAERQRIVEALEECGGNQTRAAKLLGMPLRVLVVRMAEYNVVLPRKRS